MISMKMIWTKNQKNRSSRPNTKPPGQGWKHFPATDTMEPEQIEASKSKRRKKMEKASKETAKDIQFWNIGFDDDPHYEQAQQKQ